VREVPTPHTPHTRPPEVSYVFVLLLYFTPVRVRVFKCVCVVCVYVCLYVFACVFVCVCDECVCFYMMCV